MLELVVRVNNARNSRLAPIGESKRKLPALLIGEIGAEEGANPSPSTFGDRNDDGVATGELAGAAAEVPSYGSMNLVT